MCFRLWSCGLSALLALGAAALVWAYLDADHPPVGRWLYVALPLTWVAAYAAAWKWLTSAGSAGAAWVKMRRALGVMVALVVLVVALDFLGAIESEDDFGGGPRCPDCPPAAVERVVDGDTLIADGQRVRLYGIDAPEVGERCAREATERLRQLAGAGVRMEEGPRSEDPNGRKLAYLYREDGRSIDAALVWGGYAIAWTADGQHRAELAGLEHDARGEGRGCLWR